MRVKLRIIDGLHKLNVWAYNISCAIGSEGEVDVRTSCTNCPMSSHLSCLFNGLTTWVCCALQYLHLHKTSDANERYKANDEQRQFPAVHKADDNTRSYGGKILQRYANTRASSALHRGRVGWKARTERASAVLFIVEVSNFLSMRTEKH